MVALLSGVPPTHTGTGTSRVQGDPAAARVQAGSWFSHVVVGEDRHLWTRVIMLVGLHTGSRQGLLAAPSWDGGGSLLLSSTCGGPQCCPWLLALVVAGSPTLWEEDASVDGNLLARGSARCPSGSPGHVLGRVCHVSGRSGP